MQGVKQKIVEDLRKIVKGLTDQDITPNLEYPKDEQHGDYSSNIAMALFRDVSRGEKVSKVSKGWRTPLELAQEIVKKVKSQKSKVKSLEKVEAVAPGFINFWLSKEKLTALMIRIIRAKERYGSSTRLKNKKIMVEFTDPNPFKEFHIGHLYSNVVGESLSRLLESQGAIVWRVCYQGDVGLHVAKALYGLLQISNIKYQISNMGKKNEADKARFLGDAYAFGTKAYEEDEGTKKEIEKINKQVYDKDPKIMPLYKRGRKWSLDYFDKIYSRVGTKFKKFYFESEAGEVGVGIVKNHIGDVFEESSGAVIFRAEKYGLHNRVFINSLGLPTYEAKDLGLAIIKYKDFPYDLSIIITANEQSEYFRVVLKALSLIEAELARKTTHIAHGVVRLAMGKMSSRTGTIITGEWLLNEAKHRIITKYKEMNQDTAEKVAVGAVKYALLKSGIGRDIAFDFEESISLEGNSGPYLQYTFARTQSVLAKLKTLNSKLKTATENSKVEEYLQLEEVTLLRAIHRFPEVVEEAAESSAPNIMCNYLFDLAQKFNLFYQKVPIIKQTKSLGSNVNNLGCSKPTKPTREFRVGLTMAVGQVIKNGLHLLGIKAPQKM